MKTNPTPDLSILSPGGSLIPMVDIDDLLVQLVDALDRDLELLAILQYRLIVLGSLAAADQGPSIPTAVREIEVAYEDLRLADLLRATATVQVADEFALDSLPRLDEIAARSSGGWSEALLSRRVSLLETIAGIKGVATTVRAAMGRRAALAEEALSFLRVDGGATYGRVVSRGGVLVEGVI
jgi:hypothetical protein